MLKISQETINGMEGERPGVRDQIMRFENADLPACPKCNSENTADVQIGFIVRTMYIASATTKFHLLMNLPRPGRFFCNACREYFDVAGQEEKYGKATGGFTIKIT